MKETIWSEDNSNNADFDNVGNYDQNAINGFDGELIDRMFDCADMANANEILDAMAGDGNLTVSLYDYCKKRQLQEPRVLVYELSEVQARRAAAQLQGFPARVVRGDILKMKDCNEVPKSHFDRVMLKSANHEIPEKNQLLMYENILATLKPGGTYVNLGMLFEEPEERDEVRELARVKDTLAGMHHAAQNRHFLTQSEIERHLKNAGFVDIEHVSRFNYRIRSPIVARYYFRTREEHQIYHQQAVDSKRLMRNQRVVIEQEGHTLIFPGKITLARRPR